MRVAVTGATGFVGRRLVEALVRRGDRVVALGRHPERMSFGTGVECLAFDPAGAAPQPDAFAGADAVIHLAGESISGRWTPEKKRLIRESRTAGTALVVASLADLPQRPRALISASAVGFYGSRGDEALVETSAPGTGFLPEVCAQWEAAALAARDLGIRTVCLRTGIVLGAGGGALAAMLPPFRFGMGGPFGSGRQFVPWIHLDDLVNMYLFALDGDIDGPINAVAPDYATSARFAQALGSAIGRPALIPAPGFALHIVLGEFASTLLDSQLVIPARAEDAGFAWQYRFLEAAMIAATGAKSRKPAIAIVEYTQTVPARREDIFDFFSSPHNLEEITPPTLRFTIAHAPGSIERGAEIDYRLSLRGIPMKWRTLISRWESPARFVDVQLHGPYALWHHEHEFRDVPEGTLLIDRVHYVLPFAPFGGLVGNLVRADVEQIFAFRQKVIAARFAPSPSS